jgi:hypothetical protein
MKTRLRSLPVAARVLFQRLILRYLMAFESQIDETSPRRPFTLQHLAPIQQDADAWAACAKLEANAERVMIESGGKVKL